MPDGERRAHRAAGVARCGLDPDMVEDSLAKQLAIRDAVQRNAPGEADSLLAGEFAGVSRHP